MIKTIKEESSEMEIDDAKVKIKKLTFKKNLSSEAHITSFSSIAISDKP